MGDPRCPAHNSHQHRMEVGGCRWVRLLHRRQGTLHPPPYTLHGRGRGVGGSEPASGEGASDGLRALKKGARHAARPFSVFSGRIPKLP